MNKLNPKHVLLLGCGDIGSSLGQRLLEKGNAVTAVRRNVKALPEDFQALGLDYSDPEQISQLGDLEFDSAVFTPTPSGPDEAGYRSGFLAPVENLLRLWQGGPPRELFFVSSTRVYGDHGGDWVDETSALRPGDAQARCIAAAEALLLDSPHRVTVVRFSGIYGRQPSALLARLSSGRICAKSPARFSNRIHREDCVGFLEHLLSLPEREALYLASDSEPVLQREMEEWMLAAMGVDATSELAPRNSADRRCCNRRLLDSGYSLRYPDFRAGYRAMISSTSMSADLGKAAT